MATLGADITPEIGDWVKCVGFNVFGKVLDTKIGDYKAIVNFIGELIEIHFSQIEGIIQDRRKTRHLEEKLAFE